MELRIVEEQPKCLKCGYVRLSSDAAPDYACPRCGAVYAKLEALQKAREDKAEIAETERNYLERGWALRERFDLEQAKREAAEGPRYRAAHAIYLLMILPFAVSQALAIALAYKMRNPSDDTWLGDHFRWQIRTFWYLCLLSVLAVVAALVGGASTTALLVLRTEWSFAVGLNAFAAFGILFVAALAVTIYRIGKGWYRLYRRESP